MTAHRGTRPTLDIDCGCHLCLRQLSAHVCGPRVVLLEPEPIADGTHALVGGHIHEIVSNDHASTSFKIRAVLVGDRQRFREHARYCEKRIVNTASMKPTQPTGVFNRGDR
jgi:hypothetical protein